MGLLTNNTPVSVEWPINKKAAPDQVLFRNRPPVAAVVTVVTVIAHREIAVLGDGIRFRRPGEIIAPERVAPIRRLGRHDAPKSGSRGELAINIEQRRIDAQRIVRDAGQSFDKKWRTGLGIVGNTEDMVGAKNKNVAVMRLDEVVTELVDKNLISCVDGTAGDDIAAMINVARPKMKIRAQRFRRRVNQKLLMLTNNARESKKECELFRHDLNDFVVPLRDDIDVVATENNKFGRLPKILGEGAALGWPISR